MPTPLNWWRLNDLTGTDVIDSIGSATGKYTETSGLILNVDDRPASSTDPAVRCVEFQSGTASGKIELLTENTSNTLSIPTQQGTVMFWAKMPLFPRGDIDSLRHEFFTCYQRINDEAKNEWAFQCDGKEYSFFDWGTNTTTHYNFYQYIVRLSETGGFGTSMLQMPESEASFPVWSHHAFAWDITTTPIIRANLYQDIVGGLDVTYDYADTVAGMFMTSDLSGGDIIQKLWASAPQTIRPLRMMDIKIYDTFLTDADLATERHMRTYDTGGGGGGGGGGTIPLIGSSSSSLPILVQGEYGHPVTLTWTIGTQVLNLTGASVSGVIRPRFGVTRPITGTITVTNPTAGVFTWEPSAQDTQHAGDLDVQFNAVYGANTALVTTFRTNMTVCMRLPSGDA